MGYKNATTLKGGLKCWAKVGYPIQTELGTTILKKIRINNNDDFYIEPSSINLSMIKTSLFRESEEALPVE